MSSSATSTFPHMYHLNDKWQLLEGDVVKFDASLEITHHEHKKVASILHPVTSFFGYDRDTVINAYDNHGTKTELARIEWHGETGKKDRIRIRNGDWRLRNDVWQKDVGKIIDTLTGPTGKKYVWYLQKGVKVLTVGDRSGPVIAKFETHGADEGTLYMTDEAMKLGEMFFFVFFSSQRFKPKAKMLDPLEWFGGGPIWR